MWVNTSTASTFAGQDIQIPNYDTSKYDAIQIVVALDSSKRYGSKIYEVENEVINNSASSYLTDMIFDAQAVTNFYVRDTSYSISGTTLTIHFADATYRKTGGSWVTANNSMIPLRILGFIHND